VWDEYECVLVNCYDDNKETKEKEKVFLVNFVFYEVVEFVTACLAANICLAW